MPLYFYMRIYEKLIFSAQFVFNENLIFAIFAEMKNFGFFQFLKKWGFQGNAPHDENEPFERGTSQKCY